jgi:hypothetical protein
MKLEYHLYRAYPSRESWYWAGGDVYWYEHLDEARTDLTAVLSNLLGGQSKLKMLLLGEMTCCTFGYTNRRCGGIIELEEIKG